MAVLEAYQINSLQKINDFYHYLNLLSATDDTDLQMQIKENIYALFEDRNILVDNILTETDDRIPLSYLLDNIASKKLVFAFKNEQVGKDFYRDYWVDSYTLEINEKGKTTTQKVRQSVYLKPETKAFGKTTKTVLSVSLGAIE
jgi:hypothetical protein